jgi:hypothetical protein
LLPGFPPGKHYNRFRGKTKKQESADRSGSSGPVSAIIFKKSISPQGTKGGSELKLACTVLAASALFLFGFPGPVSAESVLPGVSKVDLYPRGARILFSAPAAPIVSFELPGTFSPSSVRPLPEEGQKILSFEAVSVPRPGWIPETLKELHGTIKENEEKLALLTGRISAIQQSFELLSGPLPKDLKGSDMPEYIEAARKTREKLESELIAISSEIEEGKKTIEALKADFSARMPRDSDRAVIVTVRAEGGKRLLVEAWTQHADGPPLQDEPGYQHRGHQIVTPRKSPPAYRDCSGRGSFFSYNDSINYDIRTRPLSSRS